MTKLRELANAGQSAWYDNLSRGLINSGALKGLIDKGILGVTTNPAIFEKSIATSADYDRQIRELTQLGRSAEDIYDELTASDVRDACNIFSGVYRDSGCRDGFVSIEVLPRYAHDADKTIDYARHISNKIGCENLMVKIPATDEGMKAVRQLIREGISINITLIFSAQHYIKAAKAYIDGISGRLKDGKDVKGIASVASVFVSRVDTAVDKMLEGKPAADKFSGKVAVANSKVIYREYKKIFSEEPFLSFAKRSAKAQRLLWASTGTKNPAYSDLKYVEELIGSDTVNTMPPQTIDAFLDHGKARLSVDNDLPGAKNIITGLAASGISVDEVCKKLQDEGLRAFENSFVTLVNSIEVKSRAFAEN